MNKTGRVYRVYNSDQSAWVDVLRYTEMYVTVSSTENAGQMEVLVKLDWTDGETEASREYEQVTIPVPHSGNEATLPDIKLNAITKIRMYFNGQDQVWTFDNVAAVNNREIEKIKVNNVDVPDPNGMDWDNYKDRISAGTDSIYTIDVAVTKGFRRFNAGQEDVYRFNNDDVISRFGAGSNPIVYLDPFQVIVNTSFKQTEPVYPQIKYIWAYLQMDLNKDDYLSAETDGRLNEYFGFGNTYDPPIGGEPVPEGAVIFYSYTQGDYEFLPSVRVGCTISEPLQFSIAGDPNGNFIYYSDGDMQDAFETYVKSKLSLSLNNKQFPIRLKGSGQMGGVIFRTTIPGFNIVISANGSITMYPYYQSICWNNIYLLPEYTPIGGIPGDMGLRVWYTPKPFMKMGAHILAGDVGPWDMYWAETYMDTMVEFLPYIIDEQFFNGIAFPGSYQIIDEFEFDVSGTFDGKPLEIVGYGYTGKTFSGVPQYHIGSPGYDYETSGFAVLFKVPNDRPPTP